ncbi:hypothetical protein TWF706_004829 [Orbilia oligospora]|nr:hypothetical protein TWF706_004829 [Orbilia oligospora]
MSTFQGLPHNSLAELNEAEVDQSPLLGLPLDVFLPICEYAGLKSRIALSLTTKRLRYLSPKKEDMTFPETLCVSRIYRQILPPLEIECVYAGLGQGADPEEAENQKIKCQFCLAPLCSPRCSTALFLDIATGTFYPESLYPVSRAKLLCYPDTTTKDHEFAYSWKHFHSSAFKIGTTYSTIWCEHHRCPRDIFAISDSKAPANKKSSGKSNSAKEKTKQVLEKLKIGSSKSSKPLPFHPIEKLKFEIDLSDVLNICRGGHEISRNWMVSRFYVGDRAIPESTCQNTEPVYERAFYDILCRHCLRLHLKDQPRHRIVPTKAWTDTYISSLSCVCNWTGRLGTSGCGTCGISTVKFTSIEAFDPTVEMVNAEMVKQKYPLYLATECRIEIAVGAKRPGKVEYREREVDEYNKWRGIAWRSNGFRPSEEHETDFEIQRIVPQSLEMAQKQLAIVRGEQFAVLPPPPRVGITDLPYPVLKKILVYVLGEDGEGVMEKDGLSACLRTSYVLYKAWYCEDAASAALEWMRQEVRETNKGFYF